MRVLHSPIPAYSASLICLLCIASGCNAIGPRAIESGRPLYNRVISETNAEQVLSLIVRIRYGNSAGMMKVASVTASIDASSKIQADAGVGAQENYDGNLLPVSATLS